jgi:hypothetical protein
MTRIALILTPFFISVICVNQRPFFWSEKDVVEIVATAV